MTTRIRTGALAGIDGRPVDVEVDISRGLPGFHLVGLAGVEVRESRERVLSAVRNGGLRVPPGRITVNLAPAGVRKTGASFDLAIAMGILAAARMIPSPASVGERAGAVFLGELSLFGELRPVRGLLAMTLAAAATGARTVVVPAEQAAEAAAGGVIDVVGVPDLGRAVDWWRTGRPAPTRAEPVGAGDGPAERRRRTACAELSRLHGQSLVRKAAVLAAAGRHHLLLVGPPGTGKTRLARLLGDLQAPLSPTDALTVTRIHGAAGVLRSPGLVRRAPFRAPHHTVTAVGLTGGGAGLQPGEATLAHAGILFLDEMAEFRSAVLDALREPLQEGEVHLTRAGGHRRYPARFQLVAAMNPCRCGFLGSGVRSCRCTPAERNRYAGRISGPLLDRFDLFVEMGAWEGGFRPDEPTAGGDWRVRPEPSLLAGASARLAGQADRPFRARATHEALAVLETARRGIGLSLRGAERCLRVAGTVAALDGSDVIGDGHVREALEFRSDCAPGSSSAPPDR